MTLYTGLNEVFLLKDFNLYPNPGSNILNIKLTDATNNITIDIIDPVGKIVASYNKLSGEILQIDTGNLATGAYLISIKANGKQGKKVWLKL